MELNPTKQNLESTRFSSPEEELEFLRKQLELKEAQLQEHGQEVNREYLASETIQEYRQSPSEEVLQEDYHASEDEIRALGLELEPEEHDWRMAELISLLKTKGVKNTFRVVDQLDSPHVDDDFHRLLVQYLQKGYPLPGLKNKTPLYRALNMVLYEVVLPPSDEDDEKRDLKTLVSSMEQLYAGLLPDKKDKDRQGEYFTIELAVEHIGEEISIYCAVPKVRQGLFERQVLSLFPYAHLNEVKDDYNIFNEDGFSVGSIAKPEDRSIFTIKTYENFDHDPLSVILNAFSKLAEQGEGAAVQVIYRAPSDDLQKKFEESLKAIEKGESVRDAINTSTGKELWKITKDMFGSGDDREKKEPNQLTSQAMEEIKKKISSTLCEINIRIVVSAADPARANELLNVLESAFSQFDNTNGFQIRFKELRGKELDKMLHRFSFRLYDSYATIPLNLRELTSIVHFPVRSLEGAREVKENRSITAPAPIDMPKEGIKLGINKHRGHEMVIHMAKKDRVRHMYVIGQTGTGKTVLLTNMILQDIQNGEGCCFIDPHGSDIQYILANVPKERYDDVIYFDPSHLARPIALNMLEYDARFPEQKTFVINELLGMFNKLFDMKTAGGPMFEQYFRNATGLVMEDPSSGNTLLDISRVLADENFRRQKLSKSRNPIVNQFWNEVASKAGGEASLQNIVPYITSKFDGFLSNDYMRPIIAQERSTLNFREIMDSRKILLVNLSKGRLGDLNANLLGLIIVGKIFMAAMSRVDSFGSELPPFYLYIDEFQNVTTDSIASILSEARKYNLALVAAHQYIKQLQDSIRDAVFGNVGSMAVFRVSSEDAEVFEKLLAPEFSSRDIQNIPNWNAYVKMLSNGVPIKPFSMATLPPPEGNTAHLDALKELSYLKYGRPRDEIEREIMARYNSASKQPDPSPSPFF